MASQTHGIFKVKDLSFCLLIYLFIYSIQINYLATLRRASAAPVHAVSAPLGVAVGVDRAGVVGAGCLTLKKVVLEDLSASLPRPCQFAIKSKHTAGAGAAVAARTMAAKVKKVLKYMVAGIEIGV